MEILIYFEIGCHDIFVLGFNLWCHYFWGDIFRKMRNANCCSCPILASFPRNCELYCMICREDRRLIRSVNISVYFFFASVFFLYENRHVFIILNGLPHVLTKFPFTVVVWDFNLHLPIWICNFAEEKNRSVCGFHKFIIYKIFLYHILLLRG